MEGGGGGGVGGGGGIGKNSAWDRSPISEVVTVRLRG